MIDVYTAVIAAMNRSRGESTYFLIHYYSSHNIPPIKAKRIMPSTGIILVVLLEQFLLDTMLATTLDTGSLAHDTAEIGQSH